MATKIVDGEEVEESKEDIVQREADAAAEAAGAPIRELRAIDASSGMERWERDVVIAVLPEKHPQRLKAEAAEAEAAVLRDAV